MQEINNNFKKNQEETKAYIETLAEYYKLIFFKISAKSTSMFFKFILILVFTSFIMLFISIGFAILIGNILQNQFLGFLTIAIFYFLCLVILLAVDKKLEGFLLKKLSKIFFNN